MGLLHELEAAYAARKDTEIIEEAALEQLMYDWAAAKGATVVGANAAKYAVALIEKIGVGTIGDLRDLDAELMVKEAKLKPLAAKQLMRLFPLRAEQQRRRVDAGFAGDSDPNSDPSQGANMAAGYAAATHEADARFGGSTNSGGTTESETAAAVAALMAHSGTLAAQMVQVSEAHERTVQLQAVAAEGAALKAATKVKELKPLEFPKARVRSEWIPLTIWLMDIQGKYQDVTKLNIAKALEPPTFGRP